MLCSCPEIGHFELLQLHQGLQLIKHDRIVLQGRKPLIEFVNALLICLQPLLFTRIAVHMEFSCSLESSGTHLKIVVKERNLFESSDVSGHELLKMVL